MTGQGVRPIDVSLILTAPLTKVVNRQKKAVTFNCDRDEESYYSANMIQLVLEGLDDNLEEVDRRSEVQPTVLHRFAMAGHTVSLETDGFPNNKIPVLLDGGCTHILFNNPGHFVDLSFQINGHVLLGDGSQIPVGGIGTVNV